MNKKILILVASLAVIIALIFVVLNLNANKGKSDTELFSFQIEDTASVDKLIITDPQLNKVVVVRGENGWTLEDGSCIIQENIHNALYTLKNVEFKGYLPENARKHQIKLLSTSAKTVEIFQNGEWTKTWYIGTSTQDHYGQVMLLDSREDGKSDLPVLMKVRNVNGIIEPNFSSEKRQWTCTKIFSLEIRDIKKVEMTTSEDPGRSFSVEQNNFKFKITQAGKPIAFSDTMAVLRYLSAYKKVNYEMPNYILSEKQIDSMKQTRPFATLRITETKGKSHFLKMYRMASAENFDTEYGEIINHDMNSFWCVLPRGEVVKCQYFVFDPLLRGDLFFPFDVSLFRKRAAEASVE